jgi:membrane protease YdiL (CAAX protease family)
VLVGLLVVVVYAAILLVLEKRSGVPYTAIADRETNLRRGVMVPVAVALAVLLVYAIATGGLVDALTYSPTVTAAWLWVVPALIVAGIVLRLATTDWRSLGGRRVLVIAVSALLVGVSEELLIRGLFLDTLQDAGLAAVWVAVVTSIVFGLLHGMNILLGQDVATTLAQVVSTTLMGLALFTSLALSGSLWLPIALHALFDFSLLAQGSVVKRSARPIEVALTLLPSVLAVGVLFAL